MPRLVALDLPGGPRFVDAVVRAWDDGDAVCVLARDAGEHVRAAELAALDPDVVVDADGAHGRTTVAEPLADGDALVVLSSGTGGRRRAAVHTMAGVEAAAFASAVALGVDPTARWLACLPLHHVGGFGVVARSLVTGAGLEVHDGFDATAVMAAAAAGCTHTSLVPTALGRIDPAAFRRILVGGARAPVDRPPNCVATYGMTETLGGVVYDGLALPGVDVRVDDAGEIWVRSPTLLRCYRDGGRPVGVDGWYATGDLGTLEADTGHLHVEGRAGDVINTGGEKVWPTDVEEVLRRHRGVADVAVVGRPDPEWGERVVAVVVPSDAASPPSLEELRALVRAHLAAAAAPREVRYASELPRTALGKVVRGSL